jgi:DNA-3-methyladenine glycosylase II
MWSEEVSVNGLYDFDYVLSRLAFDPLLEVSQEERYVKLPIKIGTGKYVVKVQGVGSTEKPTFILQSKDNKTEIIKKVKEIFQWDKPLNEIHQFFLDTSLAPLFKQYPGTPIVRDLGLYEALMKTIVHQQLNMKFAYTLTTRFVKEYGEEIDGLWFYPSPEKIASLNYEDLRPLQFSQRKAEYIIDTSRLIVEGKLDLDALARKSDEEIMETLVKIRGIGHWTAENWLLFGLGRNDLLPAADIGIQNALKKLWKKDAKPSKEEIYQAGEEWTPYRSYASITLWRSIESKV